MAPLSQEYGFLFTEDGKALQDCSGFRVWQSPSIPTLSVISAQNHAHQYPAHLHDGVEIMWNHSGRCKLLCRGAAYTLRAGDVCILAPNEVHSVEISAASSCTTTLIHVPAALYWPVAEQVYGSRASAVAQPLCIVPEDTLGDTFVSLINGVKSAADSAETVQQLSYILSLLMLAPKVNAAEEEGRAFWHPAVVHAREAFSNAEYAGGNLSEMAAEVGLNVRYFISLFKDGTGLSPHQYQIAMRVERARSLMQGLHMPLCEVAVSSGFADQSHLNRHFKRRYGYTPKAFQQNILTI